MSKILTIKNIHKLRILLRDEISLSFCLKKFEFLINIFFVNKKKFILKNIQISK